MVRPLAGCIYWKSSPEGNIYPHDLSEKILQGEQEKGEGEIRKGADELEN